MDENQFNALVEKVGKEAAEKIKQQFEAHAAKAITTDNLKESLVNILKDLKFDAESIVIGEKSIAAILKEQGMDITRALEAAKNTGAEKPKGLKDLLAEKKAELEAVVKNKSGFVTIELKAAATMTSANTIDEATNSLPDDLVESMTMAAFAGKRYGKQFIGEVADRITVTDMERYTTWLEEGSEQGAFAIVSEGGLKPLVSYDLVRNVAEAQKVAGKYVVTEEFSKFYKKAYEIIRRLIMDKMMRDYNALLTTDFNSAAASYAGTTLDTTITAPNDYDAIGAVCAQIEALNFVPNVIVLNPQDKWRIRLNKDGQGRYQFQTTTENGTTKIFELNLVTSTYQTAGYFSIGESGLFKVEEETIQVRIGYGITMNGSTPESDFDYNRFRVVVETFFKDYLPTPYVGSIVRTQFSTVKTALLATQS